jgi:hypothetical protein
MEQFVMIRRIQPPEHRLSRLQQALSRLGAGQLDPDSATGFGDNP